MADEKAIELWEKVGGALANAEYEETGPGKREIEEMASDAAYEQSVVRVVADAWDFWVEEASLEQEASDDMAVLFCDLPEDLRAKVASLALRDPRMQYGTYRGRLPEPGAVLAAVRAIRPRHP